MKASAAPQKKPNLSRPAKGLKPKNRQLATKAPQHTVKKKLTANQWQNTPQQNKFMELWLDPNSDTFSNAYRSALKAKYSNYYALRITADKSAQNWISEYMRANVMDSEHVRQGIQNLAMKAPNSRSPDDTRLKAYELLAKATGLLNDKPTTTVNIVQPILGGRSITDTERIVIDQ